MKFARRTFNTILKPKRKYHIVGIRRCGTLSLEKYLKAKGHKVVRNESIFGVPHGISAHLKYYPDYQPIFIIRDPIQRIFSHYNFTRFHAVGTDVEIKCSFEEALEKHPEIIGSSCYEFFIEQWKPLFPIVIHLEELVKLPDFRHEHKSNSPKMTPLQIALTQKFLDKRKEKMKQGHIWEDM